MEPAEGPAGEGIPGVVPLCGMPGCCWPGKGLGPPGVLPWDPPAGPTGGGPRMGPCDDIIFGVPCGAPYR